MTDEERKEAKRLAKEYVARISGDPDPLDETASMTRDFTAGYAAACEAKQASFGKQSQGGKTMLTLLEFERARSAELLETIKEVIRNSHDIVAKKLCSRTLAEYEAGHD